MRAVIFWIGFVLVFAGALTGPVNLLDLLMKEEPRKQLVEQLGTGALAAGGTLVLIAWLI